MNTKKQELELLNIQLLITLVALGASTVSLFVIYNRHLKLSGQKTIFTEKEADSITTITKWVILITLIVMAYVSYQSKEIIKEEARTPNNLKAADFQIWASILATIAAVLVVLAVSIKDNGNTLIDIENSTI